jgi:hypothetical protein
MKTRLSCILFVAVWATACSTAPGAAPLRSHHGSAQSLALSPAGIAAHNAWAHALDAPQPSAQASPGTDASGVYPAFTPDAPSMVTQGGTTLHAPKLVTVTWDEDPNSGLYEAFDDQLGTSSFWTVMSGFGVGPATNAGHVHVPGPFPSIADDFSGGDTAFQDYLRQHALNPASGWPQSTDETLYALWLPPGAGLTVNGSQGCVGVNGYHNSTVTTLADGGSAPSVVYSAIFNCSTPATDSTWLGAHEIAEGTSDPFCDPTLTGVNSFDAAHAAYDVFFFPGVEIADLCGWYIQQEPPPFDFSVQRVWSNAAMAAGHSPCAPALGPETYFNTTTFPEQMDDVHIDLTSTGFGGPLVAKGFKVPLGQERTFDVGFYSDGPTGDWTLKAVVLPTLPIVDALGNPLANGGVEVTIARPVGRNGHVAHVTVKPTSAGTGIGASYIELQSGHTEVESGFYAYPTFHTLPILIGQE